MNDWIAIYETDQIYKAEIVKGILCDNGVEAVILNQKDSSYLMFGSIKVMVNEANQEKAIEIIKSATCE